MRLHRETEYSKPTRYYSKKQEDSIAKATDGNRQKNSGATMFAKGDVTNDLFLLEAKTKTTPSESISVKKEWIEKNKKESLFIGKPYQSVVFSFGPQEENYYIIDENLFKYLLSKLREEDVDNRP